MKRLNIRPLFLSSACCCSFFSILLYSNGCCRAASAASAIAERSGRALESETWMQSRSPIGSRTYHSYCRLMIDQISRYLEYPRGTIAFLSLSRSPSLFLILESGRARRRRHNTARRQDSPQALSWSDLLHFFSNVRARETRKRRRERGKEK